MNPDDERRAVEQVAERLADRFPHTPPQRVSAVVGEVHNGFEGTPIRDFVPILVEREARERLAHPV